MAEKKPTTTRVKKSARGKRPMGLTSAIGPKATTMVVILVMAGGIMVAARQQQARAKEALAEANRPTVVVTPEHSTKKTAATVMASAPAATPAPAAAPLTTATAVTVSAKAPAVTVTGCLEQHENAFRLKDTSGAEAPKSRSWKSGFLKKGAAPLNVVDGGKALNLEAHVGRRVSVTGTLEGRDMSARSVRPLGSCKAN